MPVDAVDAAVDKAVEHGGEQARSGHGKQDPNDPKLQAITSDEFLDCKSLVSLAVSQVAQGEHWKRDGDVGSQGKTRSWIGDKLTMQWPSGGGVLDVERHAPEVERVPIAANTASDAATSSAAGAMEPGACGEEESKVSELLDQAADMMAAAEAKLVGSLDADSLSQIKAFRAVLGERYSMRMLHCVNDIMVDIAHESALASEQQADPTDGRQLSARTENPSAVGESPQVSPDSAERPPLAI